MQTSVTFAAQQKPSILKRLIHWSLSLLCACLFIISMMALLVLDTLKDSDVIDQIKTHPLVLYQIRKLIIENAIVNLNPSVSFDPQVLTHLGEKALPDSQVSLMLQSSWQIFLDWVEQPSLDRRFRRLLSVLQEATNPVLSPQSSFCPLLLIAFGLTQGGCLLLFLFVRCFSFLCTPC